MDEKFKKDFLNGAEAYIGMLKEAYDLIDRNQLVAFVGALLEAYNNKKKIFIFGNGGSSATASHFTVDFNKGVSLHLDKKFNFVCLNDNIPSLMAIGNDLGFENVFVQQLEGRLEEGDVVFGISGSGNSKNVIKAVEYAKKNGNKVLSFTGYNGGKLLELSDYPIHINVNNMQIVEDIHMGLCHIISSTIAKQFGHPMC